MAEYGFLTVNDYIAYPFIYGQNISPLPRQGIADAGFMLGVDSGFDIETDYVYLYSVSVIPGITPIVRFKFNSSNVDMLGYSWFFDFPQTSELGCTVQIDASTTPGGSGETNKGWGFITIGKLSDIIALGDGEHVLTSVVKIEPALIQSLVNTQVKTVSIGNIGRSCPPECGAPIVYDDPTVAFIETPDLIGDITLKEGYNSLILVNKESNTVEFNGVLNAGEGPICKDLLVDSLGVREDDDECSSCDGYIKSINGYKSIDGQFVITNGDSIKITNGVGITIKLDPSQVCEES
jgi:hypothetical protein